MAAKKLGKKGNVATRRKGDEQALSTAEDHLEQGSVDEESGDRWFGSDLSKALRFYQLAYSHYLSAIQLSEKVCVDGYYNATRLLFYVHIHYQRSNGVYFELLTNVDDALKSDTSSVVRNLEFILSAYEEAVNIIKLSGNEVPADLYFNFATVITEFIESEERDISSSFSDILNLGSKASELYQSVLELQIKDLSDFSNEIERIVTSDNDSYGTCDVDAPSSFGEEYVSETVLQPPDVLETILLIYKLLQAILENIGTPEIQIPIFLSSFTSLLQICDSVASELINKYEESKMFNHDMLASIKSAQINEFSIAKAYLEALTSNDMNDVISIWKSPNLPNVALKYMLSSDCMQTILERNNIGTDLPSKDSDTAALLWGILTFMNNMYKEAQALLEKELDTKRKNNSAEGVGALNATISGVLIARADLELERSLLVNFPAAKKNQAVLERNSKNLLKNALNISNINGGLRERADEKLLREKKKAELAMRLCVLEGKSSISDLDSIIGRARWPDELKDLRQLGIYKSFGVNDIAI